MMPPGFDFCPICGQDQRMRFRRPSTQEIHVRGHAPVPSAGPPLAAAAGAQFTPPGDGPQFPPAPPPPRPPPGGFPSPRPIDRTVPAPSSGSSRRPRSASSAADSLIAAVVDAQTMEPRGGMPAVRAEATDEANTTPNARGSSPRGHAPVGDDDRTVPHPRLQLQRGQRPVAISPVRASIAPATQPDRPGGFSGGPGHGPLPTVNRAQRGTLVPDASSSTPVGTGRTRAGAVSGPRLVLVARDGSEGESFPMPELQMTIGRTHGDLLFPEDPFLSPMHVRVQRMPEGAGMAIFDAGSTNGVYLRIRRSSPVYPGDQFMIGHQLLRLENIDTQVQERPPAIDGTRVFGTPLQPAWGCVRQVGRGGIVGDKYYLRGSQVVFGREGGDLLFPNDPFVSREHARLRLELQGQSMAVFLEDLESANGSYIRIRGSAEMSNKDTFRIGDQILRLRLD